MNERDVMALLAEANPVGLDDLRQTDQTVDLILAWRRKQNRRVMLVVVIALAAVVAGLIGAFATGGHGTKPQLGGNNGPEALGSSNPSFKTIPLADASAALGAPLVLPNTDLVQPSDAASDVHAADCSTSACTIFVSFPAQSLGIRYTRPVPFSDPSAEWEEDMRSAGSHNARVQLVDLNGTPAEYLDYPGVKRLVQFVISGTWIIVSGEHDEASLTAAAQSIVDRSGS